jgi:hypothetical protein
MISFGDGIESPIDLRTLAVDATASREIALEISLDNPNADVEDVLGWRIVFRHPPNGADLQCEGGAFARVTRSSSDAWTVDTTAAPTACLYETFLTGKGKNTRTELRGRINFPIVVELTSMP